MELERLNGSVFIESGYTAFAKFFDKSLRPMWFLLISYELELELSLTRRDYEEIYENCGL